MLTSKKFATKRDSSNWMPPSGEIVPIFLSKKWIEVTISLISESLFKITNEMEDTKSALKEAEALVERLRRHLAQLEGMHKILTKK